MTPTEVRTRIGMVFQKPNPFPAMSIGEQRARRAQALRSARLSGRDDLVEESLRRAGLWDEVKDRLNDGGMSPVGRSAAAALHRPCPRGAPEVLLMDEPCSALDPISTRVIEETIRELAPRRHDRDRHPQHAAGAARVRRLRVLPGRGDGLAGPHRRVGPDEEAVRRAGRPAHARLRHAGGSGERSFRLAVVAALLGVATVLPLRGRRPHGAGPKPRQSVAARRSRSSRSTSGGPTPPRRPSTSRSTTPRQGSTFGRTSSWPGSSTTA